MNKITARNYIIRHNGDVVPWREIFTNKVFIEPVLDELDKNVIIPKFKYSSLAEVENDELSDLEQMEGNDSND